MSKQTAIQNFCFCFFFIILELFSDDHYDRRRLSPLRTALDRTNLSDPDGDRPLTHFAEFDRLRRHSTSSYRPDQQTHLGEPDQHFLDSRGIHLQHNQREPLGLKMGHDLSFPRMLAETDKQSSQDDIGTYLKIWQYLRSCYERS